MILQGFAESEYGVMTFSPDGRFPADRRDSVAVWDLTRPNANPKLFKSGSSELLALAFTPDGQKLIAGGADGMVKLWRLDRPGEIVSKHGTDDKSAISSLAVSPDGKRHAAGRMNGTVWVNSTSDRPTDDTISQALGAIPSPFVVSPLAPMAYASARGLKMGA